MAVVVGGQTVVNMQSAQMASPAAQCAHHNQNRQQPALGPQSSLRVAVAVRHEEQPSLGDIRLLRRLEMVCILSFPPLHDVQHSPGRAHSFVGAKMENGYNVCRRLHCDAALQFVQPSAQQANNQNLNSYRIAG